MSNNAIMLNSLRYFIDDELTQNDFTFTGTSEYIDDGNGNWRIKFKSSGIFTPLVDIAVDVFLVGGGGSGGRGGEGNISAGGGGGYTATHKKIDIFSGTEYQIEVGAGGGYLANGGKSSAFEKTVNGGITGNRGGAGGSGGGLGGQWSNGSGGSDGSDGHNNSKGIGQHTTTREFGEPTGDLYAGGGGSALPHQEHEKVGGKGGGGYGALNWNSHAGSGAPNTGGGGGGTNNHEGYSGKGGSGIVIIRNAERQ